MPPPSAGEDASGTDHAKIARRIGGRDSHPDLHRVLAVAAALAGEGRKGQPSHLVPQGEDGRSQIALKATVVIASIAKQSSSYSAGLDCFAMLAMTMLLKRGTL
jgi:hypothetical protein